MGRIFINNNKQLRSGWKITIAMITVVLFTAIIVLGAAAIIIISKLVKGQTLMQAVAALKSPFLSTFGMLVQPIMSILAVILCWKIFDRKPLKDMGLPGIKHHWKDFGFGLFLGIASIAAVFVILRVLGMIEVVENFESPCLVGSIIKGLILFILVGFSEEILARGYNMTVLKQTGNKWVVVLVSSVLFSLMHGLNPNITFIGFLNIFLIAILFAYMFMKTDHIWIPIGYHITWNFFQGNIFGFQVSGIELEGLYKISLTSNNIWNGGKFGAEGGLVTTVIIVLGLLITRLYTRKYYYE